MRFKLPAILLILFALFRVQPAVAENWPAWRGPRGDGSSLEKNVPDHWNGPRGENIAWKVEIPGQGHASPIICDDRIFVVTCREDSQERLLLCLDRASGRILWQQIVLRAALERKNALNSYASSTPASDGKLVYVTFFESDPAAPANTAGAKYAKQPASPGWMVVAAYDFDGKRRWLVRPGAFNSPHGFCSPPLVFEDLVIVNGDHDGDAYLVALKRATGETVWKVPRTHRIRSYCPPLVRQIDGRTQMVLAGAECVASYDPRNGKQHWVIEGPTEQYVASLVYNGKLFFMTAGFPTFHILAIRPDGQGDVTKTHVVWQTTKGCALCALADSLRRQPPLIGSLGWGHGKLFRGPDGRALLDGADRPALQRLADPGGRASLLRLRSGRDHDYPAGAEVQRGVQERTGRGLLRLAGRQSRPDLHSGREEPVLYRRQVKGYPRSLLSMSPLPTGRGLGAPRCRDSGSPLSHRERVRAYAAGQPANGRFHGNCRRRHRPAFSGVPGVPACGSQVMGGDIKDFSGSLSHHPFGCKHAQSVLLRRNPRIF